LVGEGGLEPDPPECYLKLQAERIEFLLPAWCTVRESNPKSGERDTSALDLHKADTTCDNLA
jgi:hypothetical protein